MKTISTNLDPLTDALGTRLSFPGELALFYERMEAERRFWDGVRRFRIGDRMPAKAEPVP